MSFLGPNKTVSHVRRVKIANVNASGAITKEFGECAE